MTDTLDTHHSTCQKHPMSRLCVADFILLMFQGHDAQAADRVYLSVECTQHRAMDSPSPATKEQLLLIHIPKHFSSQLLQNGHHIQ